MSLVYPPLWTHIFRLNWWVPAIASKTKGKRRAIFAFDLQFLIPAPAVSTFRTLEGAESSDHPRKIPSASGFSDQPADLSRRKLSDGRFTTCDFF